LKRKQLLDDNIHLLLQYGKHICLSFLLHLLRRAKESIMS
jgi:hypothetical protein